MVYQITEKNQILVALFAVVVLCAGKLFKDYLYRSGYVEGLDGMIISTSANTPMSRPVSGNKTFLVYFTVKLPTDLGSNAVIKVELPADSAGDVTLSTSASEYSAKKIVGGSETDLPLITSSPQPVYTASGTRQISWTLSSIVDAGSMVKISIPGTLYAKSTQTGNESFGPFKVYAGIESESKSISIVKSGGVTTSESTTTSAIEIRNAINSINTRLTTAGITNEESTSLHNARSALVTVLAYTYGTVKEAGKVFDSDALYEAQRTAMEFIKREKERAKNNATALKEDNSNKRRMAQVNTYYTRNYEANTDVMKNIIFVSIALIILAILRNKELIPSSISTLGVIFILMMGGIVVGSQVFDIIRRNDHDFDKYDWSFNEDEFNRKQLLQQNADPANLSEMGMGMAPCYGPGCCDVGTIWNNDAKKCIPSVGRVSGFASWASSIGAGSLTISLKVSTALVAADTITITLPTGLFSGTPLVSGTNFTGTPSASAPFTLTVAAGGVSDATTKVVPNIVITGMTLSSSASYLLNQLKVKTSKDTNESGITITGII
jgi:hypothetical protein